MSELSHHQPKISHPMLRVIVSRLKAKAEELLAEEQAAIRPGWSTVEQLLNSLIIIEKHPQHQRDLFHNFIHLKKAFDRVWHGDLLQFLRSFSIEEGLVQAIQALYENSCSAVLLDSQLGEFFNATVVRDAYAHPSCSTCCYRRSCRKHWVCWVSRQRQHL